MALSRVKCHADFDQMIWRPYWLLNMQMSQIWLNVLRDLNRITYTNMRCLQWKLLTTGWKMHRSEDNLAILETLLNMQMSQIIFNVLMDLNQITCTNMTCKQWKLLSTGWKTCRSEAVFGGHIEYANEPNYIQCLDGPQLNNIYKYEMITMKIVEYRPKNVQIWR